MKDIFQLHFSDKNTCSAGLPLVELNQRQFCCLSTQFASKSLICNLTGNDKKRNQNLGKKANINGVNWNNSLDFYI